MPRLPAGARAGRIVTPGRGPGVSGSGSGSGSSPASGSGPAVPRRPLPPELRLPHPQRLPPRSPGYERILAAHEAALDRGDDGYLDPRTGRSVLTAAFLWDRDRCCDTGCRHCPYLPRPED